MRDLVTTAVFAAFISFSFGSARAQNAVRLPPPDAGTKLAAHQDVAASLISTSPSQTTDAVGTPGPQPSDPIQTVAFGEPVGTASLQRIATLEAEVASLRQRLDTSAVVDRVNPGWSASLDYLNWTLQRRGLDFAIPTTDTALSVGVGEVRSLNFGPDAGFRTSLGYLTPNGWETTFRYTSFETQANGMADDTLGNLWATRAHPDRNEEAETAEAFGSFDYDIFDLELQRWLVLSPSTGLAVFGGFRWADIGQNFRVDYDGQDFSDATFQNNVDMTGFGLRMGGEGHWRLTNYLSLFGRAAGTVCLLYTSPSPRDATLSRMPSSA